MPVEASDIVRPGSGPARGPGSYTVPWSPEAWRSPEASGSVEVPCQAAGGFALGCLQVSRQVDRRQDHWTRR